MAKKRARPRKRIVLQKLIKVPPRPKALRPLQQLQKELEEVAKKNGFLVRRGEYLLQQSYHLRLQWDELKSDHAALQNTVITLLEKTERLLARALS